MLGANHLHLEGLHLVCIQCGRTEEVTSPLLEQLKNEIIRKTGFEVRMARVEASGYCQACMKADPHG